MVEPGCDSQIRSGELRKILAVMGMSSETPEIKLSEVLYTAGLEEEALGVSYGEV